MSIRKLAAHFRKSGSRTKKLRTIAAVNNFKRPLRYPAYFEVRWSEFTFNLFYDVLRNWRSSIKYFQATTFSALMNQWLIVDKLHFITFLIDVLGLLKAFQKTCQSDTISMLDVIQKQHDLFTRLESCKYGELEGGWEELFLKDLVKTNKNFHLYGRMSCSFTSARRQFIVQKLVGQLKIRFDSMQQTLKPLVDIKNTVSTRDLQHCHSFVLPDFDEDCFCREYKKAADLLKDSDCKTTKLFTKITRTLP